MKSKEIWEKRDNIWKSISSSFGECVLKNECQFEVQTMLKKREFWARGL